MDIKKIIALTAAIWCMSLSTTAQSGFEEIYEYEIVTQYDGNEKVIYITGIKPGVKLSGEVRIPGSATLQGKSYPVIGITGYNYCEDYEGKPAFLDQAEITSVYIPSTIKSIQTNSFKGCKKIKEFKVSSQNQHYKAVDGVLYQVNGTFDLLLRFPPAKTSSGYTMPERANTICRGAFADNYTVKTLRLSLYQDLGAGALEGNLGITRFELDNSRMFTTNANGDYLMGRPGSDHEGCLVAVAPRYKMDGLLTLPSSVKSILAGALTGSRASYIAIPSSVSNISVNAFSFSSFKEVLIPATVSYLSTERLFEGCQELTKVTISSKIKDVGYMMFRDCPKLSEINLPSSCEELKSGCFMGCKSLTEMKGLYRFPKLDKYGFQFMNSGLTAVNIPSAWETIPPMMFQGCSSLSSVTFTEGTESVCHDAFDGTALETLNLRNINGMGYGAFQTCGTLRKIIIPDHEGTMKCERHSIGNTAANVDLFIDHKSMTNTFEGAGWHDFIDTYGVSLHIYTSKRFFSDFFSSWADLYVPAGSSAHYRQFACDDGEREKVYEMFSFSDVDIKNADLTVTPEFSWVKITGVRINGEDATLISPDRWRGPVISVGESSMNVVVSYTARDVKMSTEYNFSSTSGGYDAPAGEIYEPYILEGRSVRFPVETGWSICSLAGSTMLDGVSASADISSLPAGIYILRGTTPVRSFAVKILLH